MAEERAKRLFKFQSTLPAWGATGKPCEILSIDVFQSTLPAWGATSLGRKEIDEVPISIHAPRVGSDLAVRGLI